MYNNIGKFNISYHLIKHYPEIVKMITKDMIIICTANKEDFIEYIAIGNMFEEISDKTDIPYYMIIVHTQDKIKNKTITYDRIF